MIILNRILVPTDFSNLAVHALRYACEFARTFRTELHVLHVVSPDKEVPVAGSGAGMGDMGGVVLIRLWTSPWLHRARRRAPATSMAIEPSTSAIYRSCYRILARRAVPHLRWAT